MKYFLIAGEASGDLHASNLMKRLKERDTEAQFCFLGGDLMVAQGGTIIKHYRQMSFMGFINVLKNSKIVLQNLTDCKQAIKDFQPDVIILIDYPSFNLRIAKFVKEEIKDTPIFYYISPKIWAWKEFRIKQIKQYIDKMFTILPFETEFYRKHNFDVTYVGNPTAETIYNRPNQAQTTEEFLTQNALPTRPIIALLAGSRKQEIRACLPKMIQAAEKFSATHQIIIAGAPSIEPSFYSEVLNGRHITLLYNQTYNILTHADVAVVNSGTATLETAIIGTPEVVVYHVPMSQIALKLKKIFIKVKYISLVNLIAKEEIVKELLGHHFTVHNLQTEIDNILHNADYKQKMLNGYSALKKELGNPQASTNAARAIIHSLKGE